MKNFWQDENGQGMVEYGLIIALIAVVAIVAVKAVGDKVSGIFSKVGDELGTSGTNGG